MSVHFKCCTARVSLLCHGFWFFWLCEDLHRALLCTATCPSFLSVTSNALEVVCKKPPP